MLSNCTLEFNNEYYNQLYGTPMGAPVSVRIANIFMYKLLNKFLDNYKGPKPLIIGRLGPSPRPRGSARRKTASSLILRGHV